MSAGLDDLLARMREHPSFKELLQQIPQPVVSRFKPSSPAPDQDAQWHYQSGRIAQDEIWRQLLDPTVPHSGGVSSQHKENPK